MKDKKEQLIADQDRRNRRLKRPGKKQRKTMRRTGLSEWACMACDRVVTIPWAGLNDKSPVCRFCDGTMILKTALLNKGVIPKL